MERDVSSQFWRPEFWQGLWDDLKLSWFLLRDPRVPLTAKLVPAFILVYLISPVDLIPGFIPLLGQMDDLALLIFGIRIFLRLVPEDVIQDYRSRV